MIFGRNILTVGIGIVCPWIGGTRVIYPIKDINIIVNPAMANSRTNLFRIIYHHSAIHLLTASVPLILLVLFPQKNIPFAQSEMET